MANSARALLTRHPKEQVVRICALPSLCIYPSLHHLHSAVLQLPSFAPHPAMLGKGCHSPLDAEVGLTAGHHQGEVPRAVSFLSMSAVVPTSHLPCLLNLATTTKIIVGISLSLRLLLSARFAGN